MARRNVQETMFDSTLANQKTGKTIEEPLKELRWNQQNACNQHGDLLGHVSNVVDTDLGNPSSTDLCNLLFNGNFYFSFDTDRHINESTVTFTKSTSCFKQIQVNQLLNCSHFCQLCLRFTLFFHILFR